jgi:RNA polymerase sigma factor (sigma-70 family)
MSDYPLRTPVQLQPKAESSEGSRLSDAELLKRLAAEPDAAALETLLWRHGPMVLGVCRRVLGHEQDSEDAFQAVMLTLIRRASSIRKPGALGGWLYQVACRVALEARTRRSSRRARERPLEEHPAAASPEDVLRADVRALLDEEIHRLPQRYQRPIVLYYFEGKTVDEVARTLQIPRGTIGSWLARARERLRGRLVRRGVIVSAPALVATLTDEAGRPVLAPALVDSTVNGVFAVGNSTSGIPLASRTIALSTKVVRAMAVAKLQSAGVVLLGVALLGTTLAAAGIKKHTSAASAPAPQTQADFDLPIAAGPLKHTGPNELPASQFGWQMVAPPAPDVRPVLDGEIIGTLGRNARGMLVLTLATPPGRRPFHEPGRRLFATDREGHAFQLTPPPCRPSGHGPLPLPDP